MACYDFESFGIINFFINILLKKLLVTKEWLFLGLSGLILCWFLFVFNLYFTWWWFIGYYSFLFFGEDDCWLLLFLILIEPRVLVRAGHLVPFCIVHLKDLIILKFIGIIKMQVIDHLCLRLHGLCLFYLSWTFSSNSYLLESLQLPTVLLWTLGRVTYISGCFSL